MKEEVRLLMERAQGAKFSYKLGKITREEAKEDIMPYINKYNEKAVEIAKKYGMKAKKLTFISFIR